MSKLVAALVVGGGLVLAGCATGSARQAPVARVVATFDEHGMTGRTVALMRDDSSIRGRAYGRPVSLQWDGTDLRGSYRDLPVTLAVLPAGEATRVEGEFYGASAAFQYAPRRLEGFLGGCAFHLEDTGGGLYEGRRACPGQKAEALSIAVPEQLEQRSEAERAAWLALLLTDETIEVPFVRTQVALSAERMHRPRMAGGCRSP